MTRLAELFPRIMQFRKQLADCDGPMMSLYDARFHRLDDAPMGGTVDALLALCRQGEQPERILAESKTPVLFTGRIHLLWFFCPLFEEDDLVHICALGPFFTEEHSSFSFDAALANAGASLTLRAEVGAVLHAFPVLSRSRLEIYSAMLFSLLTDEKLRFSDVRLCGKGTFSPLPRHRSGIATPAQAYAAEQELLRRVREGDAADPEQEDRAAVAARILRLSPPGGSLKQIRNTVLGHIMLLSRAAVDGGLSPSSGIALCHLYQQDAEAAETLSDLSSVVCAAQRDFAERVHAVHAKKLSREIEDACSYIDRNLENELLLSAIAEHVGLTAYYFSRKFKREVGMPPAEFIRRKRLQQAATMLRTTDTDVKQIAERFRFCSQSYFTDLFRRYFGVSPYRYRKGM